MICESCYTKIISPSDIELELETCNKCIIKFKMGVQER